MNNLTITIMAAGEGKRMNSIIPKVLHNFNGIPMLIRIILESIKLSAKKIVIITGKYDTLIKSEIQSYFDKNNISFYEKLIFVQQTIPNGTGDAIRSTLDVYSDSEDVLILNGDMPLLKADLLQNFMLTYSPAKLLVAQLDNPYGYGRILYEDDNNHNNNPKKFIGIKEEKDCSPSEKEIQIINAGIYFFHSTILKKYIPLITNDNAQNEYYLTDIVKFIRANSNIDIDTYQIDDTLKYQIQGVNTQKELHDLETNYA
jgi:bifunctional UDP-N-acetylglucosamine pyrophosphorylase/glucosamine-1-phosphate N-acetyltransferase